MKLNKNYKLHLLCNDNHNHKALAGVFFDSAEKKLVSSNGAAMAIVEVNAGENDKTNIIPVKAYKEALKKGQLESNSKITVGNVAYKSIEEKYPNYEMYKIIDMGGRKVIAEIKLDTKMLYALAQALGNNYVTLSITDDEHYPIRVTNEDSEVNGIIMQGK